MFKLKTLFSKYSFTNFFREKCYLFLFMPKIVSIIDPLNTYNVGLIHTGRQRESSCRNSTYAITVVIEHMMVLLNKIKMLELIKHEDTTQQYRVYLCVTVPSLVFYL